MKVCFETFGCRLNRAEALEEEAKCIARGWEVTDSHADANLIIVRGCSVTHRAQRDCEKLIEHIRQKYPFKRLLVTGCLENKTANHFIADPITRARSVSAATAESTTPAVPTRTARAFLKIQDGCNSACTFCIVPKFRGKSISTPFTECLDNAKRFIDAGYHEIVVTGCNLAQYLHEGKRLSDIVSALAALSPDCRIRLGSVEPGAAAVETVHAMAENKNVCRFMHLPIQSGSVRILSAMRRPYLVKDIETLVNETTRLMPSLGLGCDVMTGFPDETDNDFLATMALLRRQPFNRAHVFPYSERPGTRAASFPCAIPPEVRSARAHEVADMMDRHRTAFAKRFVGKTVEVLVEDEKNPSGWTGEYLWCRIGGFKKPKRKELVRVRVRESDGHVLSGDPI